MALQPRRAPQPPASRTRACASREIARGRVDGDEMEIDIEVHIDDLDRFLSDPHHEASLTGHVRCPAIGGDFPITAGTYNLFIDDGDAGRKKVTYHMEFGDNCVLNGEKDLHDDARSDPAAIRVELLQRNVAAQSGTLSIGAVDFLKHLASFRSEAATGGQKAADLKRFGAFYLGRLWDVYARAVLPVAPF